jgi:hypothetical protein
MRLKTAFVLTVALYLGATILCGLYAWHVSQKYGMPIDILEQIK